VHEFQRGRAGRKRRGLGVADDLGAGTQLEERVHVVRCKTPQQHAARVDDLFHRAQNGTNEIGAVAFVRLSACQDGGPFRTRTCLAMLAALESRKIAAGMARIHVLALSEMLLHKFCAL
jgi:hypothetical protein